MALDLWGGWGSSPMWDLITPDVHSNQLTRRSSNATDIVETKDAFLFSMEAPGFKPDEISIDLKEDHLSISGKHAVVEERKDAEGHKVIRRESRRSEFSRSFGLPTNVRADDISASLEHGILKVTVPKEVSQAKSRRIAITSN